MNSNGDKFKLTVNFEGKDYDIIVEDIETANLILNDSEAAHNLLLSLYPEVFKNETSSCAASSYPQSFSCDEPIWTRKRPTERDLRATDFLLDLRQKFNFEFDDKKTHKGKLWHNIAQEMEANGFQTGENGAERCGQKFANLTKAYIGYVKHQKKTGEERGGDIPPHFDKIHCIIGSKHKVNPVYLEDTEGQGEKEESGKRSSINEDKNESESEGLSSSHSSRFKESRKRLTPLSKSETMIQEIKKVREAQEEKFSFLEDHLEKTFHQRERFIGILEDVFSKKHKKGNKTDSSNQEKNLPDSSDSE